SCHHVADPRETQRRLRFASACIETGIAIHRLILLEVAPVKIGGKIGAALHSTCRIDVNGSNARATGLSELAADVAWQLLEVVIGVRDDTTTPALERQKLGDYRVEIGEVCIADEELSIPVFCVGIEAKIHTDAMLRRVADNRQDLIEIVVLDDAVEPDVVDAARAHRRYGVENSGGEPGDAARGVVPGVEI